MQIQPSTTSPTLRSSHATIDSHAIAEAISNKYHEHFDANMQCQYEDLLVVTDQQQKVLAAVGYRKPASPFFLEHYLADSAENCLEKLYGRTVERRQLVEVGNFISYNGRAAYTLMHKLMEHLLEQEYEHLLITCTRQLKHSFGGLPFHTLATASRSSIPSTTDWGSYYQHKPEVVTGALAKYDHRFARFANKSSFECHYCSSSGERNVI